jgi:hypothetical protein
MDDALIFLWFFGGLFVLRIIAATFVYAWLLSEAPECPACGGETFRIQRRGVAWFFPRLRPSWCPECAWEGMLQPSRRAQPELTVPAEKPATRPSTLPLVSRKSSK